jgi:membrane protein
MKRWWRILAGTVQNWIADNAFKHAAAVSFYTLFSLSPIVIIAVSIAGAFYGEKAARGMLSEEIAGLVGEAAAVLVEAAVEESRPEKKGWIPTLIGIGTLVLGATAVFAQLQDSLNAIWSVAAKPSRSGFIVLLIRRLLSFALVLTVGFLLLVSLVITTAVTATITWTRNLMEVPPFIVTTADTLISLTVITVLFALIFKVLPDVQLRWRDVWKGALITALLFSVGRFGIAFYLGQSTLMSTYGAAGSLVAVLLWVYYSCLILLLGVEFTRTYLEASGRPPPPKAKAVRVRREVLREETEAGADE